MSATPDGRVLPDGETERVRRSLARMAAAVRVTDPVERTGHVEQIIGLVIESSGPAVELGEVCRIEPRGGGPAVLAEAVGFRGRRVLLMPLEQPHGLGPGSRATATDRPLSVPCGPGLLGRVLDGLGRPLDGGPAWAAHEERAAESTSPSPLDRAMIDEPLPVGVRSIDGLLTCGRGQRLGIFAGSGVGKSTLLGMVARNTAADVSVIALVGERGREVREFLRDDLGAEGLRRAVVVVATSDQPALCRIKAALVATTIAEYFRDQGRDVMLMMDSLTRFALAQREVGLASGEPPATRGYTPSVFGLLPRLLERSGRARRGSITGFYTVLVEGDDMAEPVADAARSLLDGHIVLTRELAERGHYPPVDVLQSTSRLMARLCDPAHIAAAQDVRAALATFRQAEDLVNVGAYRNGSNAAIDRALDMVGPIREFLRQSPHEQCGWDETRARLLALGGRGAAA